MHPKRLIRGMVAIAAALTITAAGSASREQASSRKDRILTLTVWVYGSGQAQWDAMVNDPRDGPGNTVRRSKLADSATAYCMGTARYRVERIQQWADGGLAELEEIESGCPTIGISGGGRKRESYNYQSLYGGGTEWSRDQASWTYVMGELKEPWRGPELSFNSDRDFEIRPPALPVLRPSSREIGKGVRESSRAPRHEYTDDFESHGKGTILRTYENALFDNQGFQEKLKGRLDWSKPVCISGHASLSETSGHPIVLVHVGNDDISGGDAVFLGAVDVYWTVSDEPSTVEMDLVPQPGYERWLPRGGKDEKTPGSSFAVEIDIHKAGQPGVAPEADVKKITVWLADTSKESGVSMNAPKVEKTTRDYDFRIRSDSGWTLRKEGQEADEPEPKSTLFLNCFDYGGWTQVMAAAELADGRLVVGRIKGGSRSPQLAVPKDDNGNHIADGWETTGKAPEAAADTDSLPRGNDVEGDGLSQYEEYRGFTCKGAHTRTDPIHKDLFIYDPGNLGIGIFGESGITVHFVNKDEFAKEAGFTNENVINGNRDFATLGPQHLLPLSNMRLKNGTSGGAIGTGPGTPKETEIVAVDIAKCSDPGSTIAHELGHGCNLWHHGETDYQAFELEQFRPGSGLWKPSDYAGKEDIIRLMVAAKGGQESGVEECIMRYNSAFVYACEGGDWRWHRSSDREEWIVGKICPETGPQTIFCIQKTGTGVNAPDALGGPMAGDATKGACFSQFQVNDLKPVK
jgi:hypothetical protein